MAKGSIGITASPGKDGSAVNDEITCLDEPTSESVENAKNKEAAMAETPSFIQPGAALRPPSAEIGTFRSETPVYQMIPPDQIGKLSPSARKLTKGDLLALAGIAGPKKTLADLNITIQDIQTVSDAIQRQIVTTRQATDAAGLAVDDISISCCCCTPCCCCAVAVIQPIRPLV